MRISHPKSSQTFRHTYHSSQNMSGPRQLSAFLALAVIASVGDARSPQQIVGGRKAALGEFPYQVSLTFRGKHVCGGSIIGERHVITAAHCVADLGYPYADFGVSTGTILSRGGQIHKVKSIVSHEGYENSKNGSPDDIAIIELTADIKFDKLQNKIKLPKTETKSREFAIATGWGLQSASHRELPDNLMRITLTTLEPVDCQLFAPMFTIYDHQICSFHAPGHGVCMGDSGGPLALNDELIGIVSYGQPCGRGVPDVYTGVYHYLDWIKEKTGIS